MRTCPLLAFLLLSLALVAQTTQTSSRSFADPQAQQTQPPASVSETGGSFSGHCPVERKPESAASPPGKVSRGRLIHRVSPSYPAELRKAHVEGTVLLCATIGKDGKLHNLSVLSGPSELVPYAWDAVEQWRYEPYRVNKEPVDVDSEIRIDFKLSR